MEKDWVVVYKSDQLYRIELVQQVLHGEGIESVVFNQKDRSYPVLGEIELLVKNEFMEKAAGIIKNLEL